MSSQGWRETLINAQVDGPALNTSTTATSILAPQAKLTLPSGYFDKIGKALKVRAQGRVSTFTSGTLTLAINLGTIATPIIVFTSQAITMTASQTNLSWDLEVELVARAIGSATSANLMGIGRLLSAAAAATVTMVPASAPAVGTGFDSTITNVVDLFATWSVSNAANSIQCHTFSVESLN
jgi:hypothetical protein